MRSPASEIIPSNISDKSRKPVVEHHTPLQEPDGAPGTINLRLGALRLLAYEASVCGLLSTDLAAAISQVKGVKKIGIQLGIWLTPEQSQRLSNGI